MIKNISNTNMIATIGSTIEMNDITIAVPVSIKETTGLPIPPVVAVDVNLVALELPDMTAAVPPPAIIANAQVISGLELTSVDNTTMVPAKAAKGTAILSSRLSTYGIK